MLLEVLEHVLFGLFGQAGYGIIPFYFDGAVAVIIIIFIGFLLYIVDYNIDAFINLVMSRHFSRCKQDLDMDVAAVSIIDSVVLNPKKYVTANYINS